VYGICQVKEKRPRVLRIEYFGTMRKVAARIEKPQICKTYTVCGHHLLVRGMSKARKVKTHEISVGSKSR